MRKHLFKAKRLDNGEWVYGYLFMIWECAYTLWGTTNGIPNMIEVDPSTVCEFTGLTDKNGREIFEGDVIRTDEDEFPVYTVVWQGKWKYPAFDVEPQIDCDSNGLSYLNAAGYNIEIISSIHDAVGKEGM